MSNTNPAIGNTAAPTGVELKPCPFCKEVAAHVGHHGGWSQVHCDNCGAKGSLCASDARAVEIWNLAAPPATA